MSRETGQARMVSILKPHITAAVVFSIAVNVLFLVSPLYMLQVYDRVLTTGSVDTLILLSGIAIFLLVVYLFAEGARRRIMARGAEALSEELAEPALRRGFRDARATPSDTLSAVGSLTQIQQLLTQGLPGALLDLPFVPFFLGILFLIHPVLGIIGLVGAAALVGLAVLTERLTRQPMAEASRIDKAAQTELGALVRQRGAVVGMGMTDRAVARWFELRRQGVEAGLHAGTPATFLGSATRALRMILQIAILGAGAYLAVRGAVSSGAIIAGSIIMGRGLAPIDQTVNAWRQYMGGWKAYREVSEWVGEDTLSDDVPTTPLPRPEPQVTLEEWAITVPGADKPLLPAIDKQFERGRIVAVLGPSGSGKTSLLQTLAAAWPSLEGSARLGSRDLWRWDAADRGRYVGYLPQHVELLRGTVKENICRFTDAEDEEVFSAAKAIGAHELILALPDGYDTKIGEGGHFLSAGQRQCIGLARALFGRPPLIILDEPTAHLDAGLAANLMKLFAEMARTPAAERPMTAFIATHDLRLLNAADDVMLIRDRKVAITPREKYLEQISQLKRTQAQAAEGQRRGQPLTVDMSGKKPENV